MLKASLNILDKYSRALFSYSLSLYLLLSLIEKFYKNAISQYFNYQYILIATVLGGVGLIFFGVFVSERKTNRIFGIVAAVILCVLAVLKMQSFNWVGLGLSFLIFLYIIYLTFDAHNYEK